MIYLFDDDKYGQMSMNYKIDFKTELQKYSEYITHFISHNDYSGLNFLDNAKSVLIHNSFPDSLKTERIKAECKLRNISLVVFSNQFTGTVFSDENKRHISEIKKDRMYFNLLPFIDYYKDKEHGKIKIEILSLGKNYDLEKVLIIHDKLSLFLFSEQNFIYESSIQGDSLEIKDLKELFHFAYPDKDFCNDFEDELIENNTTSMELEDKINELVNLIKSKHEQQNSCNRRFQ